MLASGQPRGHHGIAIRQLRVIYEENKFFSCRVKPGIGPRSTKPQSAHLSLLPLCRVADLKGACDKFLRLGGKRETIILGRVGVEAPLPEITELSSPVLYPPLRPGRCRRIPGVRRMSCSTSSRRSCRTHWPSRFSKSGCFLVGLMVVVPVLPGIGRIDESSSFNQNHMAIAEQKV